MAVGSPVGNPFTLNGTTSVEIIPAPASSYQNIPTKVTLYNGDTAVVTVTVRMTVSGVHYPIEKKTALAAGESYTFTNVAGHPANATTKSFTAVMSGAAATTNPTIIASYITNST